MLREKIMLLDELTPVEGVAVDGKGDPYKFYQRIPEIIKSVFMIGKTEIVEKAHEYKEKAISSTWEFIAPLDKYSYIHCELKMSGDAESKSIRVIVKAYFKTEFVREHLWERNIFYDFFRTFWIEYIYKRKRKKLLEEAREKVYFFISNIRTVLFS